MHNSIFTLPIQSKISASISERQLDELPVIVVSHPKVNAAVTLQGAHLLTWQPCNEQPVLWLSDNTPFKQGVAIRGGVPVCWPWFGPAQQPAHGFARILPWVLSAHEENDIHVMLEFTLQDSEASRVFWPHAFTLKLRFILGETCQMTLTSSGDYDFHTALHTYFNIGDIDQISISGLGQPYIDKVNNGVIGEQSGDLTFPGRVDRIYTAPEKCSLINDPSMQRVIEVHHQHHTDVVAWNPGSEISRSMTDMPDMGYKTMVCVESAQVSQPVTVNNNQHAILSATLVCRKSA